MSTKDIAQALFAEAFSAVRQPRSGPYQLGCINYLRLKLDGVKSACPFRAGSAKCDAYLAGVDEGRAILREHRARMPHEALVSWAGRMAALSSEGLRLHAAKVEELEGAAKRFYESFPVSPVSHSATLPINQSK